MHRFLALPRMVEVADGGVRAGAGDAVGRQAQVELELAQRKLGERAEDAVGGAAGEAEARPACCSSSTSWPWKCGMRRYRVRSPSVNEASTSAAHTFSVTSSVRQARAAAERLHGLGRGIAERPVDVGGIEQPDGDEALLHVFDRGPVSCRLMVSMSVMVAHRGARARGFRPRFHKEQRGYAQLVARMPLLGRPRSGRVNRGV